MSSIEGKIVLSILNSLKGSTDKDCLEYSEENVKISEELVKKGIFSDKSEIYEIVSKDSSWQEIRRIYNENFPNSTVAEKHKVTYSFEEWFEEESLKKKKKLSYYVAKFLKRRMDNV